MMRTALSFTAHGAGLVLLGVFFWRAWGLGRDKSPAGQEADSIRKRQLKGLLLGAVAALAVAALL